MASPAARSFSPDQASQLLDHLAAQIRRTIKLSDDRHVHDLRVILRRFTQALAVLKPCLAAEKVKLLRKPLKEMMKLAGEVRNCDITVKLVGKIDETALPGIASLRRDAVKRLATALAHWNDHDAWMKQLQPSHELSAPAIRKMMRDTLARAAKRVHRRSRDIRDSLTALHKLRIAAKKLRYTLDLAGAPSDPIRDLQTRLGDINDYRSARKLLKGVDGSRQLRDALAKKQRKKVRRFRHEFHEPEPPAKLT